MAVHASRVGVRELKAQASEILRQVESRGAEFIITVRGRPVARLEPISPGELGPPTDGTGGSRGIFAGGPAGEWEEFMEAKRIWEPRPLADGD